jgi:hypothetical protein
MVSMTSDPKPPLVSRSVVVNFVESVPWGLLVHSRSLPTIPPFLYVLQLISVTICSTLWLHPDM